jgi:hypothetical protein
MASDLATALLSGNAAGLTADPAMAQVIPQLSLAQALTQQGISGAPAYPAQALGRLAQTLAGQHMMSEATGQLSEVYGKGAESMQRIFPAGTPIGDGLRSDSPYVKMMAMQQAGKAMLLNSEGQKLEPGQSVVVPATPQRGGAITAAGSPALAGAVAGAKAPYESGGTGVFQGPRGPEERPITAAERAQQAVQRAGGVQPPAPVNPSPGSGQPRNLTGPGGLLGETGAPPAARPRIRPSEPAAASVTDRINAAYGGNPVQTPELKAQMAQYGKAGEALGGVLAERIEAGGKPARDSLNALDSIESAMRANEGRGIVTGPHAESILKFREALDGMGIDASWVKTGMPQSEMIQKMNAQLAAASAKAMTGRPTQFEFASWQKNNPGLLTSQKGSLALVDVLRQMRNQDIDLSRLAQNKKNWDNWSEVENNYYADPKHGLINPLTDKPMREEIAAARGGGGGAGAASGPTAAARAPVRVSTPEEARRLPRGTPIMLPNGDVRTVP